MAQRIREVMTSDPVTLPETATIVEAARTMRDRDIGDVLVTRDKGVCGMVTDRDLVVRGLADERDPSSTTLDDVCTHELVSVSPDDSLDDAVRLMREKAVRRLPVMENDQPVGMVSIGDLAVERDPDSALADISAAPPNE